MAAIAEPTDAVPSAARFGDQTWVSLAVCKDRTDLFFPPYAERPQARVRREDKAKALCQSCPVRDVCLWWGRLHHEYGIWGGENEEDRVTAGYSLMAPIGTRHLRPTGSSVLDGVADPTADEIECTERWVAASEDIAG